MKKPGWLLMSASLMLAVSFGFFLGLFASQIDGITWDRELRLDYIANIAVTLILAFVINQVFNPAWNRHSVDRRGERSLLVDIVKNAISELEQTRAIFDQCYSQNPLPDAWSDRVMASVQRHSNAIKSIEKAIQHCGLDAGKLKFSEITKRREEYHEVLTESPFPKHFGDPSAKMRQHNGAYVALLDELHRLTLDLNRA